MTRRPQVSSGAPWESVVGYSRAVAAGDHVWVTGCTSHRRRRGRARGRPVRADGAGDPQRRVGARRSSAASLDDVVRTRIFVTDISRWEEYGRAHGEAFGEVMPATSMVRGVGADRPADDGRGRGGRLQARGPAGDLTGLAVRVIPCLDVDAGRVVKGVNFTDLRDAGDPVEMAQVYDAEGADELTFLDITASSGDRETTYDVVRRTAEQVFIPLTVGGGVRTRRRRRPAAARRCGQGRRQHRGDRRGRS